MSKNNNISTRISPNSKDAERAVLGCILINPDAISKSIQIINNKDLNLVRIIENISMLKKLKEMLKLMK